MTTREEIRKQYSAEDLALMKKLGIDPPDLEDLKTSIFNACGPFRVEALVIASDEDESAEDCEDEDESEDEDDSPDTFVDLRLKLRRSGYVLNVGSPDYDQDGRGPCGCASIRIDESNSEDALNATVKELIDSALEDASQYESAEDIAA